MRNKVLCPTCLWVLMLTVIAATAQGGTNLRTQDSKPLRPPGAGETATNAATQELHALFREEWDRTLSEHPTSASRLGDRRYNDRWPDLALPAIRASQQQTRQVLARVRRIDRSRLSSDDQLNVRLFERQYATNVELQSFPLHLLALNQREGIQDESTLADLLPFETLEDYEDWIARLRAFPKYMGQTMALLKQGTIERMVHPRIVMQRLPGQIRKQLVARPEDSLYYKPFRTFKVDLSSGDQVRLRREALAAIESCILPSYRAFLEFMERDYLPKCFPEAGCWQRPEGTTMYAALARQFTTTELTPDEIHDIGLSEVARIRAGMEAIQSEVGFAGSFQEFLAHLRSDRQFYCSTADELIEAYRTCCRTIDPHLPKLFRRLPRTGYEIRPIPDQMAPDTTTAYYQPPSASGTRPGGYYVNLYRIDTRPKYEIDALSLHESVPGHHLQIALSMEMTETPEFRRYGGQTAFVEGWALYCEKLGSDLGLYKDPYSRFGQLTYEMWRAVRLVVDTGMHHKRWTRRQAIDYFAANTAKSLHDIENEIDRYIAWPGQALAYKIGELRILELRSRAEQQLGDRFDVRDFHEVVLQNGAVPLDVLEEHVSNWLTDP
jgi:uncharacterized protein (DUF885 family)